jgi:thiosulfate reductase cytochrome b subunit
LYNKKFKTRPVILCDIIAALAMAESAYFPRLAIRSPDLVNPPRHSAVVRITHWITTFSFFGLLVSGIAILLAHPRLYWGETGGVGSPSLIDLPLPFVLVGQSGWGRSLHFLCAWICVFTGLFYVLSGLLTRHFRKNFLPETGELESRSTTYNVLQRLTYLTVVFVLFPLMIWTGVAMSPAITSVFPAIVTVFGGQQSARTIHFFVASLLVVFLVAHVAMVCLAGFKSRVGAMITGHSGSSEERA